MYIGNTYILIYIETYILWLQWYKDKCVDTVYGNFFQPQSSFFVWTLKESNTFLWVPKSMVSPRHCAHCACWVSQLWWDPGHRGQKEGCGWIRSERAGMKQTPEGFLWTGSFGTLALLCSAHVHTVGSHTGQQQITSVALRWHFTLWEGCVSIPFASSFVNTWGGEEGGQCHKRPFTWLHHHLRVLSWGFPEVLEQKWSGAWISVCVPCFFFIWPVYLERTSQSFFPRKEDQSQHLLNI